MTLFGVIGTKVTFITGGTAYELATDVTWNRVVLGLQAHWIHQYDNHLAAGGRFSRPSGIDISGRRNVYVADPGNRRILAAVFDTVGGTLTSAQALSGPFAEPVDIAWDGAATPMETDDLYVIDRTLASVTYWDLNGALPTSPLWSFGSLGTGVGQFKEPTAVCAGKSAAANGGTQFTTTFYVVDRGNKRVAWLTRGSTGASWVGTASLPNWDPIDCAVDYFGNLYVADWSNHHIHKFTSTLTFLATFGTYGKGANLGTLAFPSALSVPCGIKLVNGTNVWYCEGRLIAAEDWSSSSGATEYYLGVNVTNVALRVDSSAPSAILGYNTTDHASQTVTILDANGFTVRTIQWPTLMPPGVAQFFWDGTQDNGSAAPAGTYSFKSHVLSGYGCSGQAWCDKTVLLSFNWPGCAMNHGICYLAPPIRDTAAIAEPDPTTLFLQQRVLADARPVSRLTGLDATAPVNGAAANGGSLADAVRQYGVRGLRFSVTRAAANSPVTIRVYAMSGRLMRVLVNEQLNPGTYEVGWDGMDERGRAAAPGVYIAMMTIGAFRATQRLILRQSP